MSHNKLSWIFTLLMLLFLLTPCVSYEQQQVIRLYDGIAPGSENWNWKEQTSDSNRWNTKIVYNVVEPTLTVFPAQGPINTGTSVIIAPGGGLFALSIDSEGNNVAEWLSKKGVTAFVLRYRLVHVTADPTKGFTNAMMAGNIDSFIRPIVPLAMNDGLAAVKFVRKSAASFNVEPDRIGFMGFSAGGGVAMSVAYHATDEDCPNFIAPIYAWDKDIIGSTVPTQKIPAFIVVASDDILGLVPSSMDIYNKWIAAKQPAQLFIYQNGGHGFGMNKQDKLTDNWIERFEEWLGDNGLLWPKNPAGMLTRLNYKLLKRTLAAQQEQLRTDWSYRAKYAKANSELAAPKAGEQRVVFMGNSITEGWKTTDTSFFSTRSYINRGISGQTSSQMLLRFREDVIALKPKVAVILAGINDIAEATGPIPLESIMGNIISMVELAKANGIKVVLSSVLPASSISWRPELRPAEKVRSLNALLHAYATKNDIIYVDYYTSMVNEKSGLKTEYTIDGVHPTLAGYKVMEPLVEQAIRKALTQKR